jgi:hypothetical protein
MKPLRIMGSFVTQYIRHEARLRPTTDEAVASLREVGILVSDEGFRQIVAGTHEITGDQVDGYSFVAVDR